MKIKFYLPILALILAACSENEPSAGLPSSTASQQINLLAEDMNDDVITLVQSEGMDAAISLIEMVDNSSELGRISPYQPNENKAMIGQQASKLAHFFTTGVAELLGEEPADFIENKGVYLWNFDLEDFEKVEESDFIVIGFPTEGSETNDAEFRLTQFTIIEIDGDELPETIKADLTVGDTKYINLDFIVNYDSNGNPESADILLDVLPFSLDISFDDTQTAESSLKTTLLLNSESLIGIDVNVAFDSEDKLEPVSVSGEISYKTLKLVGNVSDNNMDQSEDGDPNDYVDLELFLEGDKLGDIIFILEEIEEDGIIYEEYIAYVQYADGTRENLEDILEPVINELEDVFEDFD